MSDAVFPMPAGCDAGESEVAEVIADLVTQHAAMPEEAVADLRRLLSHHLARRDSARLRVGHLRLLIEMLRDDDGCNAWVSQAEYMAEVERRGSLGEDYPDEAVLRRAYGRWVCAVRAAARLARPGGGTRVASSYHHCRLGRVPYGMQEVQDALLRGRADIGSWPSEWEYHEWAAIKRRISREDPRLPGPKSIRKCFGSYSEARETTRRLYEVGARGVAGPEDRT